MSTNNNRKVKIPRRLKVRPQYKGLPIPYIALVKPDGQPDFRVTDEEKRLSVIRYELCQLCGDPLGKWRFFVGGTMAALANQYFEPAAHLDCLIYAMQVCPFIVGRIEHADLGKIESQYEGKSFARSVSHPSGQVGIQIKSDSTFAAVRNPLWVIKKATGWKYTATPEGTILLKPDVVKETQPLHPESMKPADWRIVMEDLQQ